MDSNISFSAYYYKLEYDISAILNSHFYTLRGRVFCKSCSVSVKYITTPILFSWQKYEIFMGLFFSASQFSPVLGFSNALPPE